MRPIERFIEYAKMPTMSDENSASCPSTEKQRALALRAAEDLRALGPERLAADRLAEPDLHLSADERASLLELAKEVLQ